MTKLVRRLGKSGERPSFCYEAGPCGYGVWRQLEALKQACLVVAPSLIPRKAGERVKTDRRDSMSLARLRRAGELTAVWVPDVEHAPLRDLVRAREDMKHLQRQAKQRLLAFLLRQGKRYNGKSNWTQAHFRWLETIKFEQPVRQIVFQEYIDAVLAGQRRVHGLDRLIEQAAQASATWPVIEALLALRGVNLLTAVTIVAEIGDLTRFANAPQVQDIAWAAQKRLCQRYRLLHAKGKLQVQVCTAVARELAGFVWAVGQVVQPGCRNAFA